MLTLAYGLAYRRHPWMRRHPFDARYGTATNGLLPGWLLQSGQAADAHITAYAGCQPSCLRRALATIPNPGDSTFLDIGCGKGRAVIVASEWPFERIVGVELVPRLVRAARRNVRIVQKAFPRRTTARIVGADATAMTFPDGDLVVFLYHSFGRDLLRTLLRRLVEAATEGERDIFMIYENPVHGDIVDADGNFARWSCATVPCDADEADCTPDASDTFVVWRIARGEPRPVADEARTPIVVVKDGWKAALASDPR